MKKWKKIEKIKSQMTGHCGAVLKKRTAFSEEFIFMFGGWNGKTCNNSMYLLDTSNYLS